MLDKIKREDMPESVLEIVDLVGIGPFKNLIRLFAGSNVYINLTKVLLLS